MSVKLESYIYYILAKYIQTSKTCTSPLCVDSGMDRKLYPRALVVTAQQYPNICFFVLTPRSKIVTQHNPTHVDCSQVTYCHEIAVWLGCNPFSLLVLSREWMGMGVAGMIIASDYGSFPHSLRLAPVSFGCFWLLQQNSVKNPHCCTAESHSSTVVAVTYSAGSSH